MQPKLEGAAGAGGCSPSWRVQPELVGAARAHGCSPENFVSRAISRDTHEYEYRHQKQRVAFVLVVLIHWWAEGKWETPSTWQC